MSKAEQAAFIEGARYGAGISLYPSSDRREMAAFRAAQIYPVPMKTVPRELRIATRTYFIRDGEVWFRTGSGDEIRSNDFNDRSTTQLVSMGYAGTDLASIMDLIINPTQEIEA